MALSAQELLDIALINRARLDPAGEAARDHIDLNEGLAPGTITADSKQPLAYSNPLDTAARGHSQSMIDNDYFAHVDPTDQSTPQSRGTAAGYTGGVGENIAFRGSTLPVDATVEVAKEHDDLFIDAGQDGRGHRVNMLDDRYQEVGVGVVSGVFTQSGVNFNSVMLTEDYGIPATNGQFLTGIAYNDTDGNAFYSVGEGRANITVSVAGGNAMPTGGAGEYAMTVGTGTQAITFSGGGLAAPVKLSATIIANRNALIDLVGASTIETSTSVTETSGITKIIGLGNTGITLTGDGGNDAFVSALGNDAINGGGGIDTAIYSGNHTAYTVTHVGASVKVVGAEGTDTLTGIEKLQFADTTVSLESGGLHPNDFNGDGKGDVMFTGPAGQNGVAYEWQLNDRAVTAQGAVDLYDSSFSVQVTGDFDGDGKGDLLFHNPTTGGVWEWQLNGTQIASQGAVDVGDKSFHILGTADFDGSGTSDLLWRNDSGFVYEWLMNGRVDTPRPVGPLSTAWHVVGAADFNGDGNADILLRNISGTSDNGAYFLWEMNGNTIVGQGGIERPDTSWVTLGTGDFDGDGKSDIALRNTANGGVWVYLMDGTNISSQGAAGIADAATWHLQTISDLNGDGKDDILFRNTAGTFYSWDMNGTQIASEGVIDRADTSFHTVTQHWDLV